MEYQKYFKRKIEEIFKNRIDVLEKKSIDDLKEIEIIKYELNDIYEGRYYLLSK